MTITKKDGEKIIREINKQYKKLKANMTSKDKENA